jgi:hypothetical protein
MPAQTLRVRIGGVAQFYRFASHQLASLRVGARSPKGHLKLWFWKTYGLCDMENSDLLA